MIYTNQFQLTDQIHECKNCNKDAKWCVYQDNSLDMFCKEPNYHICDYCHDIYQACKDIEREIINNRFQQYEFAKRCLDHPDRNELKLEDIMMYCTKNCPICDIQLVYDKNGNVNLDRINPGDKGGEYTSNNITIICNTCNTIKGSKSKSDILKDITIRTVLAYLQKLQIPANLQTSIKIYESISNERFDIIPKFMYNDKPSINHYFNIIDNIYCVKIQDGKLYNTGDDIKVTRNDGTINTHTIKTPIIDDIFLLLDDRYNTVDVPCHKCHNNVYKITTRGFRGKNKSGRKTRPLAICLLCNNRVHIVEK